jgi:hypothetical protein
MDGSAPAGMRIEGGGFGLQIGASAVNVVMLVMSKKGMKGMREFSARRTSSRTGHRLETVTLSQPIMPIADSLGS